MATLGSVNTLRIKRPLASDNKYSRGVAGFLTGSETYPGAALLSVGGALSVGIGMVRYLGSRTVGEQVLQRYPETVLAKGAFDCLAVGSGQDQVLSGEEAALLEGAPSAVIDAFSLKTVDFARTPELSILTPHLGEFRNLQTRLGLTASDATDSASLEQAVIDLATLINRFVLLKGSTTILSSPNGEVVRIGPNSFWLATAGTGDVLTGVLCALMASYLREITASPRHLLDVAELAVLVHSKAAELASTEGPVSAHSLLEHLGVAALEFLE